MILKGFATNRRRTDSARAMAGGAMRRATARVAPGKTASAMAAGHTARWACTYRQLADALEGLAYASVRPLWPQATPLTCGYDYNGNPILLPSLAQERIRL